MKTSDWNETRHEIARAVYQALAINARTCSYSDETRELATARLDALDDLLNIAAPHDPRGWDDFVRAAEEYCSQPGVVMPEALRRSDATVAAPA